MRTLAHLSLASLALFTFILNTSAQSSNAPHIFVSNRDGDYEIYLYDASGTLTKLTDNTVDDITPTVSPDGRRVAFTRDTDGDGAVQIFVLDLQTRAARQLTTGDTQYALYPSWSPDSTRLAYTRVDLFAAFFGSSDITDIRIVTAPTDAAAPQSFTLIDEAPDQVAPAWSRDGARIAYMQGSLLTPETNPFKIYTVAVSASGTRAAAPIQQTFGNSIDITPAWSVDSAQLVFSSNSQDANFELYLLTPRTPTSGQATPSRLTFFAKDDLLPAFSLDGRSIVFTNGDAAQFLSTGETQDIPPGDNFIISNTGGTPVALVTNTTSDENDAELLPLTQTRKAPRNFSGRRRNRAN
ncbi:MAG: DPP IV N-terminal domain-containing protein [Pyrinomonadaceae bacterium MAG19_C2-C3]|nr:DPP IV N-terminal domain-containing protein [Pyrinomonadaceae bacterium MAG19_C2-C3]